MQRFKIAESGYPYFLTETIVKWLPVFVSPGPCDIIVDSLRHCREHRGLRVHAYMIMPTHLHLILSTEGDLSAILRDFKRFTLKRIAQYYAELREPPFINVFRFCGRDNRPPTEHKVWQDGSHPELVRTAEFFEQKLDYLHLNPCRKGLISDPLAWTYSSARCYHDGGECPLQVDWIDW